MRVRLIDLDGAVNRVQFAPQPGIRQARAAACHALRRHTQQHTGHRAAGGCVANAHLTDTDDVIALRLHLPRQADAHFQGARHLLPRHRGALGDVHGAAGCLLPAQTRQVKICIDAHIHRHHITACSLCQGIHAALPAGNAGGLQRGDTDRRLGDAFCDHPVVRAGHDTYPPSYAHIRRLLDGRQPADKILQFAQAVQRLGDAVPSLFAGARVIQTHLCDSFRT